MTAHILPWLRRMAGHADVWIADPGRAYLPRDGLTAFASYCVPTSLELEDRTEREVTLYRLGFGPACRRRLPLRLVAPAQLRQVQPVHRHRRAVAHDVPYQPLAIRLGQPAQHDQGRQCLLKIGFARACVASSSNPVATRCASPCQVPGEVIVTWPVPATSPVPGRTTASRCRARRRYARRSRQCPARGCCCRRLLRCVHGQLMQIRGRHA